MKNFLLIVYGLYVLSPIVLAKPSWCLSGKVLNTVEQTICNDNMLSMLDGKLSQTYKNTLSRHNGSEKEYIKTMQRKWLTKRNTDCKNTDKICIKRHYLDRINQLHEDYFTAKKYTTTSRSSTNKKNWQSYGIKRYNIQCWKREGIQTPEEALKWKKIGVRCNMTAYWKKAGITSPDEAERWQKIGINESSIEWWIRYGVKTPIEAVKWKKIGLDYGDVDKWKSVGIQTPEEASKWITSGIKNPYDVKKWKKYGLQPEEASKWKKIDIRYYDVEKWKGIGVSSPEEASEWKKIGLNVYDVEEWLSIGTKTPQEVLEWKRSGVLYYGNTATEAKNWINLGIKTPQEAKVWTDAGIKSAASVQSWMDVGFKTPQEAKRWINVGVRSNEVRLFKALHISPSELTPEKAAKIKIYYSALLYFDDDILNNDFYDKLKKFGCFADKECLAARVINSGKILNNKLLVSFDKNWNNIALLDFPSENLFSFSRVPKVFKMVNNRNTSFIAVIAPKNTTDTITIDEDLYEIDVYHVIWTNIK